MKLQRDIKINRYRETKRWREIKKTEVENEVCDGINDGIRGLSDYFLS